MKVFLASNIGGIKKDNGIKIPTKFFEQNNFLNNLKMNIKNYNKFVLVASDPTNYEQNDKFLDMDIEALKLSDLQFNEYIVLDNRNKGDVANVLNNSDLIFLCGGNTFIQNKFFNDINLKKYIKEVDAVIVGISAGSINSARIVYNSPEKEEDLEKPSILTGLEITNINIEPHFCLETFYGEKHAIQRESILKESYNRIIYALTDGAYIIDSADSINIYGLTYTIQNGEIKNNM